MSCSDWLEGLEEFAPGVKIRKGHEADEYHGTPAALLAANLIELTQMPGQPGHGTHTAVIFSDGSIPVPPRSGGSRRRAPGAKRICLWRDGKIRLEVFVEKSESDRRWDELTREWNTPSRPLYMLSAKVVDFVAFKTIRKAQPVQRW